jgi:hypothetical protein
MKEAGAKAPPQKPADPKEDKLRRRNEDRERKLLDEMNKLEDDNPMKEKIMKELQRLKIKA